MPELRLPATGAAVPALAAHLDRFAAAERLSGRHRHRLRLVGEELVGNVLRHGRPAVGSTITVRAERGQGEVRLTIVDSTAPFDPTDPLPAVTGGEGGHGLLLVHRLADEVCYRRTGRRNRTTVRLRLDGGPPDGGPPERRTR